MGPPGLPERIPKGTKPVIRGVQFVGAFAGEAEPEGGERNAGDIQLRAGEPGKSRSREVRFRARSEDRAGVRAREAEDAGRIGDVGECDPFHRHAAMERQPIPDPTGGVDELTLKLIMTALIVMVLLYTCLGGMISVILTDYAQFVVLSIGLLLACGLALSEIGWERVVETVRTVHGDAGLNPFDGDIYGPSYVVWMGFLGLISCAVWQTAVLRACAAESPAAVKKLYIGSSLGFLIRFLIPQFLGVCALAWFWQHPDLRDRFFDAEGALVAGETMSAMPVFLAEILPIGVLGLVTAGMLAAFMSTHDTYLLCWSAVITEDVLQPALGRRFTEKGRLAVTRVLLVGIAAFLLLWSMWFPLGQDLWDYMAVTGAIYFIGAFVVLTAGLYWKRTSTIGAELALLAGTCAVFGLKGIQDAIGVSWRPEHVGLITLAVAVALLLVGSFAFPDRKQEDAA